MSHSERVEVGLTGRFLVSVKFICSMFLLFLEMSNIIYQACPYFIEK